MALFKIEKSEIQKIKSAKAEKEKDIQTLFEQNLETILDIYFLETQYSTSFGGRIDTLGVDKDGSPVIIEYKKTQSESIINQGLSYLKWLLDHKDTFEKLALEKLSRLYNSPILTYEGVKPVDSFINWDAPRVVCVAENYNRFDLDTADILPIKIELLTYTLYENNILQVETQSYQKIRIPMAGIVRNAQEGATNTGAEKLQKNYTIEEHLNKAGENVKELFLKLREQIKAIDENIKEEPLKYYIAYKLTTNFTDIEIQKNQLKVSLNVKSGELNDPYPIARDMKNTGHFGNGDYELKISNEADLEKAFELIKQSYNYNK